MTASLNPRPASSSAILVRLAARPDLTAAEAMPRGAARKAAAWQAIVGTAQASQKDFVQIADGLKNAGAIAGYETLVSPNMLVITPSAGQGQKVLAAFEKPGVSAIFSNSASQLWPAPQALAPGTPQGKPWGLEVNPHREQVAAPTQAPYGVTMLGAPQAWAEGASGKGLVFGSIDTGVDGSHEALAAAYRGRNADGTITDDYNWIDITGNPSAKPVDHDSHGTHTMGTVVGRAPGAPIGIAPDAKWIAAYGLNGSTDAALKALQWMQAPTMHDGTAPDPTKAPDVVGMSWYMGSPSQDLFHDSILNLRGAGIEVVKSAGNQGPGARTITSPGQFPEIYATAAVDAQGHVTSFSSRGPSAWPKGAGTPKPDFAAPGDNVVSSVPGNRYDSMSGTSMAQPHMSGAVLDVLSKYPQLTHDQLTQALAAGAVDKGKPGRDDEYGYGIVNLPATLAAAARILGQAPPAVTAASAA